MIPFEVNHVEYLAFIFLKIVAHDVVVLAVGDGLPDRGFEIQPVMDAVADFLHEYAVTAQFVAGFQEFVARGVVDVVTVDDEFQRVGRVSKGVLEMEFLMFWFFLGSVVEYVEFRSRNLDDA